MRKRFWVSLGICLGCFGLMVLMLAGQRWAMNQPTEEELRRKCTISADQLTFTPADFVSAVQRGLSWPSEAFSEEGGDMTVYTPSGSSGEEREDALTVSVLDSGVQYEYFDSEAMILYQAMLPAGAMPETVSEADFAQAKITGIDMQKWRELSK